MPLPHLEADTRVPQSALDLAVAEQIVVWSLRRYKAGGALLEVLAATYVQIFGLAGVERALSAFGRTVVAVEQYARRRGAPAGLDRLRLSSTELCLLRLILAVQKGDDEAAEAAATWLVRRDGWAELLEAARDFAGCLAAAGQHLARRPVLPSVARTADLTPDEAMLLLAVRIWVSCAREDRCGGAELMRHLALCGAANAGPSLHGILHNLSQAATRAIDIRCRRCPNLSPDEARLLHAVACGQRQLIAPAEDMLAAWLAPAAIRLTIGAVVGAGRACGASGMALPLRTWDLAALERLSLPPPAAAIGAPAGRVLH